MAKIHTLTNVRPDAALADCQGCGPDVSVYYRRRRGLWICRTARRQHDAQRSPEQRSATNRRHALKKYGITPGDYDQLLAEQDGVCAICAQPESIEGRVLAVDHDHQSGAVRGLLCGRCNRAIGLLLDDPELLTRAANYLTR